MNITLTDTDGNTFAFDNLIAGTVINQYEGFEFAETRPVIEDIPNNDGASYITSQFGRRRLSWSGEILYDNDDAAKAARRNLQWVCRQGSLKTMTFTTYDSLTLQAEVEIINLIMPYKKGRNAFQIEAVAPDFRFYSQTLSSQNTQVTTGSSGFALPTALPLSFTDSGTGTSPLTISNGGNIDTYPTLTITGPGTNFVIQNISTGEKLEWNSSLSAGETVVIDTLNRTVLQGGTTNVYGSFDGDWLKLQPGSNTFHFNASSGTDSNTLLTVAYRDAYNGI